MKFIFYLIRVLSLLSCNMDKNRDINLPPVRPENVPNTAFWQGGKDGRFCMSAYLQIINLSLNALSSMTLLVT